MNEFKDNDLNEIEVKLKEELNAIPLESFDEMMAEIRPSLKKKRKPHKRYSIKKRLVAVATSIILILGIGLATYILWPESELPFDIYRYEDDDIKIIQCEQSDILNYPSLYVPDLNILLPSNVMFNAGIHKETEEIVYFTIDGYNMDNGIARHITLTIILQVKYDIFKEEQYNNVDNKISVGDIEIFILDEENLINSFYNYKIGFKIDNIRYYMDYQTTSPTNDIESFMLLFLK